MAVGTSTSPLIVIAGKDFGHSWEIAETETGPPQSLADVGAIEFRASQRGGSNSSPVVWTLNSGHFSIIGSEMILFVSGDETESLSAGSWGWLLSYGDEDPETPLIQGLMPVIREP